MKPVDNMDVVLTVGINGTRLTVHPRFENISDKPIYVLQGTFGIGNPSAVETTPMPLSEDEYLITLNGVRLQYSGQRSYAIGGPQQEEFVAIAPRQVSATRYDRIDDAYHFERGTHMYEITHRHLQLNKQTGEISEHRSRTTRFTFTRE